MKYYLMPEKLRPILSQHFIGILLTGTPKDNLTFIKSNMKKYKYIITIGDVVTLTLTIGGISPKLSIIDCKCLRRKCLTLNALRGKFRNIIKTYNPPGRITVEAWNSIKRALREQDNTLLEVQGEEDLLAIPAILEADNGSVVIYGLPLRGMVIVEVDNNVKKLLRRILDEFTLIEDKK